MTTTAAGRLAKMLQKCVGLLVCMSMSVAACFDDDDGDHFKMRIVNHISWLMLGTSESKIMGTKVENKNISKTTKDFSILFENN